MCAAANKEEAARGICRRLCSAGHRALLAGGCVRDMVLRVEPQDYDVATSATPDEVASLFGRTIGVGARFGVQIVVLPEGHFEVATFRLDGPYTDGRHPDYVEFRGEVEDASRRDFTINAMFLDPASNEVIDYVGGRGDLERKLIRAVGDARKRFNEDYLRMLRAVRFAARLGYTIESETFAATRELAPCIQATSPERVRDEITKMLTEGAAGRAFRLLDESGLLREVLPEIERMKGVEQPPEYHPEGDVFTHTMLILDQLQIATPTLAYGALLHDVGKPLTQTFEDRIRFNNHDKVGAHEARTICRRLHLSNHEIDRIAWLVEQHMRVSTAPGMRGSKLKRLLREDGFPELLELFRIDCESSHRQTDTYEWLRNYAENLPPEEQRPTPLITGDDLLEMGYKPGPIFRTILTAVEDAQLEGRLVDAETAREFVISHWPIRSKLPT